MSDPNYIVVADSVLGSLIRDVNDKLKEGYDLVGGIARADEQYMQAMVAGRTELSDINQSLENLYTKLDNVEDAVHGVRSAVNNS